MKWSLSILLALSSTSCTRSCAASFVPKLDLSARATRFDADRSQKQHERVQIGIGAWLRWQPVIYAAYVPERYELAPDAWVVPCDSDDSSCFAELAQDERELSDALEEAP